MGLLVALFRFTDVGLRMRASAFNQEVARLLGVKVGAMLTLGWALASVVGSLSGLLIAGGSLVHPGYMDSVVVFGFVAAVLGGLDSPLGAVVGGLMLGVSLSFVSGYVGSQLVALAALVILMLVLTLRPGGSVRPGPGAEGLMRDRIARCGATPCSRRHLLVALARPARRGRWWCESVSDYRNTQLASMAYLGIAAGGLTVLTGVNGQLSLGHGALMAIGAYTSALLLPDRESSVPLTVVVLAAVVVTLVVGTAVGLAAARLHGPYLAGATLALAVAVPGIALYFKETLGGEQGLRVVMPDIPVWLLDAVFFVTGQDLTRSRFTAYVGVADAASWSSCCWPTSAPVAPGGAGGPCATTRSPRSWPASTSAARGCSAFMVSAAAAGAAGAILAFTVRLAAPSAFTLTLSLTLLAAIVLGGLGSLAGALRRRRPAHLPAAAWSPTSASTPGSATSRPPSWPRWSTGW